MPWRQRRSALTAAQVGAAGIWQVGASDGLRYLQRPLPCGSAWMQAGQGPGSLRGAGRERRRLALDTPATLSRSRTWARGGCSSGAGPGRPRQLPACQGRSRRGGALQWRPQTHSPPAGCAPLTAHSPPARWVPMSLKPAIYDFLTDPRYGSATWLTQSLKCVLLDMTPRQDGCSVLWCLASASLQASRYLASSVDVPRPS